MNWRRETRSGVYALAVAVAACGGGPAPTGGGGQSASAAGAPSLATDADVRTAFAAATGSQLDDRACIVRPASFSEVVIVARYADPVGCIPTGAFVRGHWTTGGSVVTAGLATRGWADASEAMRRQLAWDWVQQVTYAFAATPLTAPLPAFTTPGSPSFAAPTTTTIPNGTTIVVTWVAEPPGPGAEGSAYSQQELRFAPSGELTTERLERFTVPLPRLAAPPPG